MPAEPLLVGGVVTDRSGRPVAGARVALAAGPVEFPDIAALTGDDGRFMLSVPAAGRYEVAAYGDAGRSTVTADVRPGRAVEVSLILE